MAWVEEGHLESLVRDINKRIDAKAAGAGLTPTSIVTFAHMTGELDARGESVAGESTIRYPLLIQVSELDDQDCVIMTEIIGYTP